MSSVHTIESLAALYSSDDLAPEFFIRSVLRQVQPVEAGVGSWQALVLPYLLYFESLRSVRPLELLQQTT